MKAAGDDQHRHRRPRRSPSSWPCSRPLADPARLSVADQVARLKRGKVAPDKFDYAFLQQRSGKAGRRRWPASPPPTTPPIVRQRQGGPGRGRHRRSDCPTRTFKPTIGRPGRARPPCPDTFFQIGRRPSDARHRLPGGRAIASPPSDPRSASPTATSCWSQSGRVSLFSRGRRIRHLWPQGHLRARRLRRTGPAVDARDAPASGQAQGRREQPRRPGHAAAAVPRRAVSRMPTPEC